MQKRRLPRPDKNRCRFCRAGIERINYKDTEDRSVRATAPGTSVRRSVPSSERVFWRCFPSPVN